MFDNKVTSCLTEKYHVIRESQTGFRTNFTTIDNVFTWQPLFKSTSVKNVDFIVYTLIRPCLNSQIKLSNSSLQQNGLFFPSNTACSTLNA